MSEAFAGLSGSPRFYDLLWKAALTHHVKNHDYATVEDPFKNFRAGECIGVPAYKLALLRLLEKMARVENLEAKGGVDASGEAVEDTLLDIAVLALIVSALREEQHGAE